MSSFPRIDRYEIRRGLGRGAMGSVYLAFDPKIGREVAIKVLQKEFALNEKHRERFEREARAIATLRHQNIVEIYDYGGSPDEHVYLVMEFVDGPNTGAFCRAHGPLPEVAVTALGMELARALRHAHSHGIIHRDLKPENVFIQGGRVVLADFGIAKAIAPDNPFGADAAAPLTEVIGTPGFMAPEQIEQTPLDARTDVFALGALLYYLASRKLPYDAESPYGLLKVFRETRPRLLNDLHPELSEEFALLIQECLEVNADARPASADALYGRFRAHLDAVGAREPREILKALERNPDAYREEERRSTVDYLISRLKIAVRDEDGIRADEIRKRIGVLDPASIEAMRVSGVHTLIKQARIATDPEIIMHRTARNRRYLFAAVVVAALSVISTFYWINRTPLRAPAASTATAPATTSLRVRATDRTHVFLNGGAIGATPNLGPMRVGSGLVSLEFVHDRRGRLTKTVKLEADSEVTVVVDWKRRRIKVKTRR